MEHLVLMFEHGIQDVISYCQFIERIKPQLAEGKVGSYIGDDMAIDGGDAEAVFASKDVRALYEFLVPHLLQLPFMRKAQVRLVYGPIEGDSRQQQLILGEPAP